MLNAALSETALPVWLPKLINWVNGLVWCLVSRQDNEKPDTHARRRGTSHSGVARPHGGGTAHPAPAGADEELAHLATDVRIACQRIARGIRHASDELPGPLMSVLMQLHRTDPQTPTALAAHAGVSTPAITRVINALVAEGLVARTPDPDDHRQVLIGLTERGRGQLQRTLAARDTWMLRRLDGLDADQRALLRDAARMLTELTEGVVSR